MPEIIRIGTRDSELALWQAKTVQGQLESLGYKTSLVPVKSTGDLVLDKPLYELGITGVFTRTLDIAMLNHDIDIAVHSLKDVPTVLPKGIVQAAVIQRGPITDTLVFKNNIEFLSQKDAVIATGSLRRRAQWLNRYPTHTIVDLRGNINSRMRKLKDNAGWNGAVFASAGLNRIGIRPEEAINLDWMIPAPAQGAVMITALEENELALNACAKLNHEETDICTRIEREFLNRLEGGCTAPIGAIAQIKNNEVIFKGILLNKDGSKKIEVSRVEKLGAHQNLAKTCAEYILSRGGKHIMDELLRADTQAMVYSTKTLTEEQKHLLNDNIVIKSSDFIKVSLNRLPKTILKSNLDHIIITSKNAVEALTTNFLPNELPFKNIYCVGKRTKQFIEQKLGKVTRSESNAKKLANYLVNSVKGNEVTYFCSDLRLDDLPKILAENQIVVNEVEAYKTTYSSQKVDDSTEGIMFYSPSSVQSYILQNTPKKIAFCIGETTAKEARKHFKDVRISKVPTVESVIELVNEYYG